MFSVVIPAYNCEQTICEALASVTHQTRRDLIYEIIVVNDGSTDSTKKKIQKFIKENPDWNICYLEQPHKGGSAARNRGISDAGADWIALLDADDLWLPHKLERQYQIIEQNPKILFLGSYTHLKFWWRRHTGLYKLNARELCVRSMPTTPSVVFHKATGIAHGLFEEGRRYCEDIQFFQKFLLDDSYYVLGEELVQISFQKKYFAQSGMSSHLFKMYLGRDQNVRELHQMGLITAPYMYVMLTINMAKFLRRFMEQKINKAIG